MILPEFPDFLWKRSSFDPESHLFLTYECLICHVLLTARDESLGTELGAHASRCHNGDTPTSQ